MHADFEKFRVGNVFKSRKNRVFRFKTETGIRVAKVHPEANTEAARAEFHLLERCSKLGLRVPAPIELVDNVIVMAYLEGVNLADAADEFMLDGPIGGLGSAVPFDTVAKELAVWLSTFHKAFDQGLCRGDTILRNFLFHEGRVFGLDFEEAHEGEPLQDLGELCANILGMRPLFGPRNVVLASEIASSYWKATAKDRSADLPEFVAMGLEHYSKFRADRKILETWAQRIRKEGLGALEEASTQSKVPVRDHD